MTGCCWQALELLAAASEKWAWLLAGQSP